MRCREEYRAGFATEHNDVCTELVVACPEGGPNCLGAPSSGMYPRSQADKHAQEFCRNRPCVPLSPFPSHYLSLALELC